jgi:RecG-like helicase
MPASEARIAANRENSKRSTGPTTEEGKVRSRANSLKHGLTGAGVVLVEADAAEVERRSASFAIELNAVGEVGQALARRAALNSVRMERAADQQEAALLEHVREVEEVFEAPEGLDEAEIARLRRQSARRSMFDDSKEAVLARKYEAAAERSFFRCIKELREREEAGAAEAATETEAASRQQTEAILASIFQRKAQIQAMDDESDGFDAFMDRLERKYSSSPANSPQTAAMAGMIDLPIGVPPRR